MKGIVYYNKSGKIFDIIWGDDVQGDPDAGVPFLEIDVPMGAVISEVDLSKDPPKIIFTKYPEDDYDILNNKVTTIDTEVQTAQKDIAGHTGDISTINDTVTNIELAIISIYEEGVGGS